MWKGTDWKMLFGIENEYHTNSAYYAGDRFLQLDIPYAIVDGAAEFGGVPDGGRSHVNLRELREMENFDAAARYHEAMIETRRKAGYTGYRMPNRMRIYVDMLHPEISTAECTNPRDLLLQQKASERMIETMRRQATEKLNLGEDPILVCKNNSSGMKGDDWFGRDVYSSWAMHENYMIPPDLFEEITAGSMKRKRAALWIAFLVSRIYGGSGKMGSECNMPPCAYQIFQRSDFICRVRSHSTIEERGIINTRDNPYADHTRFRRLHVICGDALLSPWSIYVTHGVTALFLRMLAEGYPFDEIAVENPLAALHAVSRDLTGKERVIRLARSRQDVSALELQSRFLAAMKHYIGETGDEVFADAVRKLEFILSLFADEPGKLKNYLDFAIKKSYLDILKEGGSDNDELHLESLEYHNMNPEEGVYLDIERNGFPEGRIAGIGSPEGIVTEEEISHAIVHPPTDSRAFFGGEIVRRFPDEVIDLTWNALCYTMKKGSRRGSSRLFLHNPWFGSKDQVLQALEESGSIRELHLKIKASL
ncbi:MAG: proteasome accessory factor PafA2 family protein [Candidatus Liptonbacteria bacterium]|nr:proteasome accessory factor PafA2 family protein [Candidatus Liptonbacteria bacterium]